MLTIIRTDSAHPDFQTLVALLDQDLRIRDGEDHAYYAQFNKIDGIRHAVVGYVDGQAVACGAFKPFEGETVEIKRMYVRPEHRGQGLAGQVLQELEYWAVETGHTACVLETGKQQPEAIRLYEKSGYGYIPNYGQYEHVENSVCLKKTLSARQR